MPHCVLDCSRTIDRHASVADLIRVVHDAAAATGLFGPNDVKVRVNLFDHYTVGDARHDFVHVITSSWGAALSSGKICQRESCAH
jgi:5-carboxymethyl-2-hydroxymuconate isomerase